MVSSQDFKGGPSLTGAQGPLRVGLQRRLNLQAGAMRTVKYDLDG